MDQGGGGGGGGGVDAMSGVVGDCSAAGEGSGEKSTPSTCSIATLSAVVYNTFLWIGFILRVQIQKRKQIQLRACGMHAHFAQ